MGLVTDGKIKTQKKEPTFENPINLSKKDLDFILEKLQSAQYTGYEFEQFFTVWKKLDNYRKNN